MGPALVVVLAAGVIGCGGGGGGGSKGGVIVTSGSNGGSGNVSTGMTTGEITSGGTAGNPTTTGGASDTGTTGSEPTTGSTTGSTTSTTDGGSTTSGTTGTDPTTGSTSASTTSAGTTGDATTGSSTTGSEPTTGSSTTGSNTTGSTDGGSTDGGTTGGAPTGLLRPNAIYFGHWSDASVVTSILPDGTGRQDVGSGHAGVAGAVADPDDATKTIYAIDRGGVYGVYRGTSFDPTASEQLAAPAYNFVSSLQPTASGAVVMVAVQNGTSKVFLLQGGVATAIDEADSAAVSLDGTRVAYTKIVDGFDDLYLWNRASGVSQRIVTGADSLFPSFSKDGAWILFSSNRDGSGDTPWDLYQIPTAGGAIQRVTNTPDVSEFGACYNETRTMISVVGMGADADTSGVFVVSNSGTLRIAGDTDLNLATYWTSSTGRSLRSRARGARFTRLALPKRR